MKKKYKVLSVLIYKNEIYTKRNHRHVGNGYSVWKDDSHIIDTWMTDFNGNELPNDHYVIAHTDDEPILAVAPMGIQ
jgi:hypothetical protein